MVLRKYNRRNESHDESKSGIGFACWFGCICSSDFNRWESKYQKRNMNLIIQLWISTKVKLTDTKNQMTNRWY